MDGIELGEIPAAKTVDEHQANPDFSGWMWGVIDVDLANSPEKGAWRQAAAERSGQQ